MAGGVLSDAPRSSSRTPRRSIADRCSQSALMFTEAQHHGLIVIWNLTTIRLRQDLIARPLDRRVAQVSLNADNTKTGQCMEGTPRLFDRIARGYPQRIDQPDKEASVDALMFLREDHKSVLGMLEMLDKAPTGSGAHSSGLLTMVT